MIPFGARVTVTHVVGRQREFMRRRSMQNPELVIDTRTLSFGHGRRPHASEWSPKDQPTYEVLGAPLATGHLHDHTRVSMVRVPVLDLTPTWAKDRPEHLDGVVVGHTSRHAGIVTQGWEEGNSWTTHARVPVVTVAIETDGKPTFYDVHPDDIKEAPDADR